MSKKNRFFSGNTAVLDNHVLDTEETIQEDITTMQTLEQETLEVALPELTQEEPEATEQAILEQPEMEQEQILEPIVTAATVLEAAHEAITPVVATTEPVKLDKDHIFEIKKNSKDTIKVYAGDFSGKRYANIRLFYTNEVGELAPTQKGVCMTLEQAKQVHDALGKVLEAQTAQ